MGKYEKGILGSFNGKVGTVIGSNWKGISYMRSLPRKSNKPASAKQLDVQSKFLLVIGFLKPMSALITDGYRHVKGSLTPFNDAVSYHLKNAVSGNSPNFEINLPKVLISLGDLNGLTEATAVSDAVAKLHLTWDTESLIGRTKADDLVSVLVYEALLGIHLVQQEATERATGDLILNLPASFSGKTVNCWITVKSSDSKLMATSNYLGEVTVL